MSKTIRIFDNEGRTLDRYTVIIHNREDNTEDIYTMSPCLNVNQYSHTSSILDNGESEPLDDEIELDACPESIYKAVHERMHETKESKY